MKKLYKLLLSILVMVCLSLPASYSSAGAPVIIVDAAGTQTVEISGRKVQVLSNTYWKEIAEEEIADHELVQIYGSHVAIGTTQLVLSEAAAGQQFYVAAADEVVATSDSNEDATGQTGALTLRVFGLTEDTPGTWVRETDDITLTGTPGVGTSTKKFIRVEKVVALTAGSVGSNVGTITFTDQGATGTFMVMTPGHGHTKAAVCSVATGERLLIRDYWATASAGKSIEFHLYVREFGKAWQDRMEYSLIDAPFSRNILLNNIPAKSDLEIRVETTVGSAGAAKAGFMGRTEPAE